MHQPAATSGTRHGQWPLQVHTNVSNVRGYIAQSMRSVATRRESIVRSSGKSLEEMASRPLLLRPLHTAATVTVYSTQPAPNHWSWRDLKPAPNQPPGGIQSTPSQDSWPPGPHQPGAQRDLCPLVACLVQQTAKHDIIQYAWPPCCLLLYGARQCAPSAEAGARATAHIQYY